MFTLESLPSTFGRRPEIWKNGWSLSLIAFRLQTLRKDTTSLQEALPSGNQCQILSLSLCPKVHRNASLLQQFDDCSLRSGSSTHRGNQRRKSIDRIYRQAIWRSLFKSWKGQVRLELLFEWRFGRLTALYSVGTATTFRFTTSEVHWQVPAKTKALWTS